MVTSPLERFLDPPSYGYRRGEAAFFPTRAQLFAEFFSRLNVFKDKRNWLPFFAWTSSLSFGLPLAVFLIYFFDWKLLLLGLVYSMVVLGSHGTFWLHRYSTHRAFQFSNRFVRFLCRNVVIKIIPEEIYVVSHHVHHQISEQPGDPYNVHGGWLYCFLADVNHQTLAKDLSPSEYQKVSSMLRHTGVRINSHATYLKWGSACHPLMTVAHFALNWTFWYGVFFLLGGHALATAMFGCAGIWAFGVRTFNFEGHGRGQDRRRAGIDFYDADLSVNQWWPGFVAGEWHNNHHAFPTGARSGFLRYQVDLPWYAVRLLRGLGWVHSVQDFKLQFESRYLSKLAP